MKKLVGLFMCFTFLMGFSGNVGATSSDGLIWTKELGIRVDIGEYAWFGVGSPEVVKLPDGTYRMYYTGFEEIYGDYRILSATSSDGITWVQESGIRINNGGIYDTQYAYAPDIVELPDGGYRMYYTGWQGCYFLLPSCWRILSAVSADGLTWTKESGVRIEYDGPYYWYGGVTAGDTIKLPDGTYRMYYSEPGPIGGPRIVSAVSSDGLTWTKETGIRVDYGGVYDPTYAADPDIIGLPDGTYRMYYSGFDGTQYRILSAVSSDGLTWTKETGTVITAGGTYDSVYVSGPNILELPGGAYRMYYGGYDGNHARILSAFSGAEVVTNRPPDCSGAVPSLLKLWPPNRRFIPISILGVTDPDGDPVSHTITSITQDEPVNGLGDGNTSPDGAGVGSDTASVRAERTGTPKVPGNGRVYQISFTASDGKGGECQGSVGVCVPHDQRLGHVCIDDGQIYDSTQP